MNKEIQTYEEKLQRAVAVIKEAILQGQYETCNMRKFYENWDMLDSNSASALAELQNKDNQAVVISASALAEIDIKENEV